MGNYDNFKCPYRLDITRSVIGLHVDSVRKVFGERQILNDIFISCKTGEIIGLLGRNGSGKSTLLKIIFGSIPAENKFVAVDGKKVHSLAEASGLICYLPQQNFLPDHVKVHTIISCFLKPAAAADLKSRKIVKPWLTQFAKQLSGGERRILEILLLMCSEAAYILLDEPFNGLSPINIEKIKEIISTGAIDKGIIITDHDYRNVLDIASSVMLLKDGHTKHIKDRDDLVRLGYLPA